MAVATKRRSTCSGIRPFYIIRSINYFLALLGLSGITQSGKKIVRNYSPLRVYAFLCAFVAIHAFCIMCRINVEPAWKLPWKTTTYMEFVTIYIATTAIIFTLISSYLARNMTDYQEYFSNYEIVDSILKIRTTDYVKEKNLLDKVYFISVGLYSLIWSENLFSLNFADNSINVVILYIILCNLSVKLLVLKNRFNLFTRLVETVAKAIYDKKSGIVDSISELGRCYQLLFKQNFILYQTHGWQILLAIIHLTMFITRGTYGITLLVNDPQKKNTVTLYILTLVKHFGANSVAVAVMAWLVESVADMRIQMLMQLEDVIVFLEKQRLADKEEFVQASILLGQIYRQPMTFSLCNVFHFNYSLVKSLVSFSVTYTIILAQIKLAS